MVCCLEYGPASPACSSHASERSSTARFNVRHNVRQAARQGRCVNYNIITTQINTTCHLTATTRCWIIVDCCFIDTRSCLNLIVIDITVIFLRNNHIILWQSWLNDCVWWLFAFGSQRHDHSDKTTAHGSCVRRWKWYDEKSVCFSRGRHMYEYKQHWLHSQQVKHGGRRKLQAAVCAPN